MFSSHILCSLMPSAAILRSPEIPYAANPSDRESPTTLSRPLEYELRLRADVLAAAEDQAHCDEAGDRRASVVAEPGAASSQATARAAPLATAAPEALAPSPASLSAKSPACPSSTVRLLRWILRGSLRSALVLPDDECKPSASVAA